MTAEKLAIAVFSALALIAPAAPIYPAADDVISLRWDDLMPPGEEERLSEIYREFYEDLDERLSEQTPQVPLAEAEGYGAIKEGGALDSMPQLGTFNTVADLDGKRVRIPGYIVPLDLASRGSVREFLLVPYFGACIHTPPPPPNQIVYVTAAIPLKDADIWEPYWVQGLMRTETVETETGDAAYAISLERLDRFRG